MSKWPLEMPSSDRLIACQSILVSACVLGEKQYLQLLQDHQRNADNAQCADNALTAHVFLNQRRSLTVRFECFVSIFYLVLFPILTIRPMSSFECSVWIFYPVRFPILTICRMFSVEYSPFNVLCECFNDIRSDFPTWPMSSSCPSSCFALHEKLLGLLDSALFL